MDRSGITAHAGGRGGKVDGQGGADMLLDLTGNLRETVAWFDMYWSDLARKAGR